MADLLENATRWLAGRLSMYASRTVTYSRGADSVSVRARVAQQPLRVMDAQGYTIQWDNRDYFIDAADLVLASSAITPRAGDRVTEADGGRTHTLEVLSPDGVEAPWRWADGYRVTVRIHTKQIGVS